MILDWVGWNDLSYQEQWSVGWYAFQFSAIALCLVLVVRALFGGLRLRRAKARKRKKAKKGHR